MLPKQNKSEGRHIGNANGGQWGHAWICCPRHRHGGGETFLESEIDLIKKGLAG